MVKLYPILFIFLIMCGCNSVEHKKSDLPTGATGQKRSNEIKVEKQSVVTGGVIFGKADFQGVLKVEYVKLLIVDDNDPGKSYELFFGNEKELQSFSWQAPPVEPKYFFLGLPAGRYTIVSITIPVGTTFAVEPMDIAFSVEKETVIYLGTLRVTGTDQKIRFGGVPLVRPGFNYKIDILNEKEEAVREFKAAYPNVTRDIQVNLMKAMEIKTYY